MICTFIDENQKITSYIHYDYQLQSDRIIFCMIDELYKYFDGENVGELLLAEGMGNRRRCLASMFDSEITTILL